MLFLLALVPVGSGRKRGVLGEVVHFSLRGHLLMLVTSVLLLITNFCRTCRARISIFPSLGTPAIIIVARTNNVTSRRIRRLMAFPVRATMGKTANMHHIHSSSAAKFSMV